MEILFPSRKIKCLKIVILLSKNKLYACVKYLSMFILTRLVFVFWDITETLMGVDLILIPIVTTKQESMYIFDKCFKIVLRLQCATELEARAKWSLQVSL